MRRIDPGWTRSVDHRREKREGKEKGGHETWLVPGIYANTTDPSSVRRVRDCEANLGVFFSIAGSLIFHFCFSWMFSVCGQFDSGFAGSFCVVCRRFSTVHAAWELFGSVRASWEL